ncbi:Z1 domain-containing protein [Streptomyces olivochromogenes]|uniref:Z1 domain-containing protein n=1 Tax=Streptomyces olivochromogenes TaxID=1963 RepID=UPI003699C7E1
MTDDSAQALHEIHSAALDGMTRGPRNFLKWAVLNAEENHPDADLSEETFRALLAAGDAVLTELWSRKLTDWDFAKETRWDEATLARTEARRQHVYERLGFGSDVRKALDIAAPIDKEPGSDVITEQFTPWYTHERASQNAFYWPKYRDLLQQKGLSPAAIAHLDEATHSVVERLTDPEQVAVRQAKGLVVGYVQSGKTANFTGVAAKAIDAGYRLVIVLGGMYNLLRAQTQRRLDKELIGQENILRGADPTDPDTVVGIDYIGDDDEWDEFISFGARPSALGHFDIERLTTRDNDYKSLQQGISALDFEKRIRTARLYDPRNLHHAAARIVVVKKNDKVLTKLVKDLKQVQPLLGELPALIIDDESDQASVNTTDPNKSTSGEKKRSAINGLITQLLTLLPRAQYVGYTATPFANVFIDPGDSKDLFPKDFLISLRRPEDYMGVQEFHDLNSVIAPEDRTVANSQELAHVRGICDSTNDLLQEALDAFLLTGAMKLYRTDRSTENSFRHHTMLVHESVSQADHTELALRISALWHGSAPLSPAGQARLRALYESDFGPVSEARANGLPVPTSFGELKPHISRARQLINRGGTPVVVVNGDKDSDYAREELDFDRTPNVWKILVGGTKLSRGFTVEGLTITYYRRKTKQADTLMQMGRWFGFRPGYQDLVRLYIGRKEPFGRGKTIDLYKAFEAICRDEEDFRAELRRYAERTVDGHPLVTPSQIPPLVSQHLPWLKPTSRNKMFNAELLEIRSPGQPIELLTYPLDADATARNTKRWQPVLASLSTTPVTCHLLPSSAPSVAGTFHASTTVVPHADLLGVLGPLEWEGKNRFKPHLRYLSQLDGQLAKVDDWLVITPHLTDRHQIEASVLGHGPVPLHRRSRQADKVAFGRISRDIHRAYAQQLINTAQGAAPSPDDALSVGTRRGVVLLYPVVEAETDAEVRSVAATGSVDPSRVIMAFTLISPRSAIDSKRELVRFSTKDPNQRDAVIVDAS